MSFEGSLILEVDVGRGGGRGGSSKVREQGGELLLEAQPGEEGESHNGGAGYSGGGGDGYGEWGQGGGDGGTNGGDGEAGWGSIHGSGGEGTGGLEVADIPQTRFLLR